MLANRETEDIIRLRKREAISMIHVNTVEAKTETTNTAVFGEMTIFSLRGNSFQSFGSRTGFLAKPKIECEDGEQRSAVATYRNDQT